MTQKEIDNLTAAEFRAVPPFDKKSCYDCSNLKQALHWWCTNKKASNARGTTLPGCIKCTYWAPYWPLINKKYWSIKKDFRKISIINKPQIKLSLFSRFLNLFNKELYNG